MPWPTNTDYQEAIQAPAVCFEDAELRAGSVATDRLGLPRPCCGNFASVYRMKCTNRSYAVRCFLREFRDQQQRYQAIDAQLQAARLSSMVGFRFVPRGIRVKGQWYPVLKMEWVQGELLHDFVRKNLASPATFTDMARKWLDLCKSLKSAGIAHGDLQHGNILVVNGQFRLIDYDGMFVPTLDGKESHEVGHPNYQHPRRISDHFGPFLDNFSSWVIYLSLVALSVDPRLWQTTNAGDECLLFRQEDFQNPDTSQTFALLERHPNIQVQTLALMFKNLVFLEPDGIPSLDGQISQLSPPVPATGDWISDHVSSAGRTTIKQTRQPPPAVPAYDATWVLDFTTGEGPALEPVRFPASLAELRTLAFGSIAVAIGFGVLLLRSNESPGQQLAWCLLCGILIPVNAFVFRSQYRNDPAVQRRTAAQSEANREKQKATERQNALAALQQKRRKLKSEETEKRTALQGQIDEARLMEARDLNAVQLQLNRTLAECARSRQQVETVRDTSLADVRTQCQNEIARRDQERTSSPQVEASEIAAALSRIQQDFIRSYLHGQQTMIASVRGMPSVTRANLCRRFPTAADIDYSSVQRIKGIGPSRAGDLLAWRKQCENAAKLRMPQQLPQSDNAAIKAKHAQRRHVLQQEINQWRSRLQSESDRITGQAADKLKTVNQNQQTAQTTANQQTSEIKRRASAKVNSLIQQQRDVANGYCSNYRELDGDIQERTKELCQQNWRLAKANRELARYNGVSFGAMLKRVFCMR